EPEPGGLNEAVGRVAAAHADGECQIEDGRREVRGMYERDRGEHRRGEGWSRAAVLDPAGEREDEQRHEGPPEPGRNHAGPHPALDAAHRLRRGGERHEGAGQREPGARQPSREAEERGDAGSQEDNPEEQLVDRRRREKPERQVVEPRPQVDEAGRIELELRVAGPPVGVPGPRRQAARETVPEPEVLPGMVVGPQERAAEGRRGPREPVREEETEPRPRPAADSVASYGGSRARRGSGEDICLT